MRFKKYNDPWEKVSLSEIVNRITRKNKLNESLLPLTISAQYGLIDQTTFFGKTVASKDLSNYYLLFRGDFAYNKSYSKDYPWGAVKRLNNFDKGVVSILYICFKPYNVNSDFLECYFETNKWNKEISDIAGEGARNHGLLNMSTIDFFSTKHYIPSMGEQAYISGLINKINERIMTQNKIIEHYESLINSIIDTKIYNFNNERETLKTYASLKNGYAFKSENYNENGQYKIVTIGNVTGDQYISDKTNHIDKIPFDIQRHQILKNNDILVSLTGNVGRVSMVNSDNCLLNQRVGLIQINNMELRNYIYVVLSSHIFEREMINKSQGAAQLNIGKSDVENYKIPKPTKTNLKISELIDKYLTKLSIEKRILELFQDEKSYLLSNLFI